VLDADNPTQFALEVDDHPDADLGGVDVRHVDLIKSKAPEV
jgi:hypothetical protein